MKIMFLPHRITPFLKTRIHMSILVVGSVAYDGIETPFGKRDRILGGSATLPVPDRIVLHARG